MNRNYIFLILCLFILSCGSKEEINHKLLEVKKFEHYPSASGIEYLNDHYYIIGDDATQLLILDKAFNVVDSFKLFNSTQYRLSKETKPDLESFAVMTGDSTLLMFGSGSLDHKRTGVWLFNPGQKYIQDTVHLDIFYQSLLKKGLPGINIEGSCSIGENFILANRGNKAWPQNHLISTTKFWETDAPSAIVEINLNKDTASFKGISGLDYAPQNDLLLLSISTEDTRSSYEDGTIGKSYVGIIRNYSSMDYSKTKVPDVLIDLEKIDTRFKGQKIESICVVSEKPDAIEVVLCADNDDGSSTIFKVNIKY